METTNQMYPLRINHYTTIYVPKHKHNEEYRQEYINKHFTPKVVVARRDTLNAPVTISDIEQCKREGLTYAKAGRKLGVSPQVANYYAKKYGILLGKQREE